MLEASGGRWIVGMIGAAIVGIAIYFGYKGISAAFRDELEPGGVGPVSQHTIVRLGQVGWVGRGVMMLLVGWFLIQAAVNVNPDEARGLDGALREATSTTAGGLLAAIAALRTHRLRRVLWRLGTSRQTDQRRLTASGIGNDRRSPSDGFG